MKLRSLAFVSLAACLLPADLRANGLVVFNEIMYHPETEEPTHEWIELFNLNTVDVDLSGWQLSNGVNFTFPVGTVIGGRRTLVVAISPETLVNEWGLAAVTGPFTGRLSNSGEKLELRDFSGRVMDSFSYGVDGNWPVGPDGGGVSLAKRRPELASQFPESWAPSLRSGGTPAAGNFDGGLLTGPSVRQLELNSTWRYQDSGLDLGTAWSAPGFDDAAWKVGMGIFRQGEVTLPGPAGAALAAGPNTYYFRTDFLVEGDPGARVWNLRTVVDDGAVIHLNGVELTRINMRTGVVNYATPAASSLGTPSLGAPISIAANQLVSGRNVLAVEVHQNSGGTNAGLRVLPVTGMTVSWDGKDGDFFSPAAGAPAPANAGLSSGGVVAGASSNPGTVGNVNDGRYGTRSSWAPAASDLTPFVYLRFNQQLAVSSVAWSRDNGDTAESECGGTCTDGSLGNYTLQYTLAPNPASLTTTGPNPTNNWTTLATIQHLSVQSGFSPHLRHRFALATTAGEPIQATGIRLRLPSGAVIDEFEINTPTVSGTDAAFGLELSSSLVLPPAPPLRFNEISEARKTGFWLELINTGKAALDLAGVEIVRSGGTPGRLVLGARSLAPGEVFALTQDELRFSADDNAKLFLYSAEGHLLLDAVSVGPRVRGRAVDGAGEWQFPFESTPGSSNRFRFQRDVVINEIMYGPPPVDAIPAVTTNTLVLGADATWRYHDGGQDLGVTWRARTFDDSLWTVGSGMFQNSANNLPAPANTSLAAGRTTYYFRTRFEISQLASNAVVLFRPAVDDGAVVYLNGSEWVRLNMPAGNISYSTSASEAVVDATFAEPLRLPADRLVVGENVLAVEVHQKTGASSATGVVLSGGGLRLVEEGPTGTNAPENLAREPGATPFSIDSLAGFPIHNIVGLTDGKYGNGNSWIGNSGSPGYAGVRLAGLRTVRSIAFGRDNQGTLSDRTLGQYTLQFTTVSSPGNSTTFTGDAQTGWATIGTLSYQAVGTGLFSSPSRRHRYTFTPVEATGIRLVVPATGINSGTCIDELEINPPDTTGDIAFGAEVLLNTTLSPGLPFGRSNEEWVELFNRGTTTLDLTGWKLDGGIDYALPASTMLPPQGYLVIAKESAALRLKWPEIATSIVGDFSGRIGGEDQFRIKDAAGNTVDEVKVFDGGWSNGGGSSLELQDPHAENDFREAWADSDETGRGTWETVTYRMVSGQRFGSSDWNEFRVGMLDAGECLLDDVSVIRDPRGARQQLIQNGDFEVTTGATHWRLLGNHDRSQIIVDPDRPGNHVLKVSSTGPSRTSHNHIESSFVNNTRLADGQEYEVSFRARWLAGSPQLHTSAYFQRLARATLLSVPARHGTPGAVNSRRVVNAGPVFTGLGHFPLTPRTNEPVVVSVRAVDPDGVGAATLSYRVNPAQTFTNVSMALGEDGLWRGTIPGFGAGKVVQFYVRAEDTRGAGAFVPLGGASSRALYQVADAQNSRFAAKEFRLIQLDGDRDALLRSTNVMSQQRQGATVLYDRSEVFYDVGVRLHGSAAGRARDGDDYMSYDVEFSPDHLFRGVHGHVGIDRSGRAPNARQQDEIYVLHMFHRAGLPCHRVDLCYFIAPRTGHTGPAILQLGAYDGLFIEEQFGEDGSVFNLDLTYEPSVTVTGNYEAPKLPVPLQAHIGTDFADLGDDKEQYRAPFDTRYNERADDFTGIMRLCKTMGGSQAVFNAGIAAALDVERASRHTALTILCGIGDNYFSSSPSLPHNCRTFTPSDGGPAVFLPWDMDFVFTQPTDSPIVPTTTANISKLLNAPATRRIYLWHVNDLCQGAFNSGYLTSWLTHYGSVVGQNYSAASGYIQARRSFALRQLPASVAFAITNNGGNAFQVSTSNVALSGTAWIDIRELRLSGTTNPLPVTWLDVTRWQVILPLVKGTNVLALSAVGADGAVIAQDQIIVTSTVSGEDTDSDGDGLPDAWEQANGTNPSVADALADLDGDGSTNLQEYLAGTDPRDPRDSLRLAVKLQAAGVELSFAMVAGKTYTLQRLPSLGAGPWTRVKDFPAAVANGVATTMITPLPAGQEQYYRVVTPVQ